MQARIQETEAEIGTDLLGQLSAAEQAEARQLQPLVARLQEDLQAAAAKQAEVEVSAQALEAELAANLGEQRRDLQDRLAAASGTVEAATLEARRRELQQVCGGMGGGALRAVVCAALVPMSTADNTLRLSAVPRPFSAVRELHCLTWSPCYTKACPLNPAPMPLTVLSAAKQSHSLLSRSHLPHSSRAFTAPTGPGIRGCCGSAREGG